jgi:hypothetical protein
LTNGEAFSTLVDGRGSLIPVLTRENDQYDINFFDSQGSLVHKRQLSAPLDSRARISPDNVVVDPAGNVWLSEGQSIYQIDVSGDALKRAGPEGDAPFLTRAATANVNRFGQILCLDACTGDLLLFDREGRLLRAEPTSSVDFPTVSESLIHARIEPTGDGDYWIASATGSKMRVRFGPDLIVKQRSDSKYRFFAIEERRSAMCEWAVGQGIAVKFPREPERKLEFDHSLDGVIVDARVLTDGSVAALAYRPNHGVSLFCHLDDPARRVRHDLPGEVGGIFLSSGDRWLIAYGVDGSGFLFDTRTWERWEYELPGDFDTRGVVRCFVDSSQTSGEELVSVNSLTRVVRRFALPKVSSSPESAPAVK